METTHQKLAEAREEMLRMGQLAALGELAAVMSHDLQQMLSLIRLAADAMSFSATAAESGTGGPLSNLESTIRSLESLTGGLASFALQAEEPWETLSVGSLFQKPAAWLADSLRQRGITLTLKLDEPERTLRCRRRHFEQMFVNLLTYCRESLSQAARREIRIWDGETPFGNWIFIHVADTGPAITPEEAEGLFLPFAKPRLAGQSPGIQLAIARMLAERHGGQISVSSGKGYGAEFIIELPVDPTAA